MKTLVAIGILGLSLVGSLAFTQDRDRRAQAPDDPELRADMRKLWEDHLVYTRNLIISSIGGLADVDDVGRRLVRSQDQIGDKFRRYYGLNEGRKLAGLLRDRLVIESAIVKAAWVGGKDELEIQKKRWADVDREIAGTLAGLNPHWGKTDLEERLQKQRDLTLESIQSRLRKDWAADIAAYDKGHENLLEFSDVLSIGIIRQHPDKFRVD